jgi:ABC-2 type transport system ATP-binding protein
MIEIRDLHKRYVANGPEAVAGITLMVHPGEVFGLLGPNGAGKTTTVGVITTRVRPTSGEVLVDGLDVMRDPVAVRTRIAVVPQRNNLDRSLNPYENLTFHAAYFGMPRRQREKLAMELLDTFGLADRANDNVMFYSGGMAQRVMVARALMHEPKALILDEPTTGLDPQSRLFLQDRIAELRTRGITIILCTHDMAEADKLCDRIAIMDHGKVIALDTPGGLRSLLPGASGLELLVRKAGGLAARLEQLPGVGRVEVLSAKPEPGVVGAPPWAVFGAGMGGGGGRDPGSATGTSGLAATATVATLDGPQVDGSDRRWRGRIYATDDEAGKGLIGRVLAATTEAGAEIVDLRRVEGSLEDVFIHLTGRELR